MLSRPRVGPAGKEARKMSDAEACPAWAEADPDPAKTPTQELLTLAVSDTTQTSYTCNSWFTPDVRPWDSNPRPLHGSLRCTSNIAEKGRTFASRARSLR